LFKHIKKNNYKKKIYIQGDHFSLAFILYLTSGHVLLIQIQ